jgi:phosphomethylpyrimidine synthase
MDRTPFTGDTVTQMHHARRGEVTPEMRRVAEREQAEPESIRAEVARGRMVIPANVRHGFINTGSVPMLLAVAFPAVEVETFPA